MSIDLQFRLNRSVTGAELLAGVSSAVAEILRLRTIPPLTVRKSEEAGTEALEPGPLKFRAPLSNVLFSFEPTIRDSHCAELHLFSDDDAAGVDAPACPNEAEVSAWERWPENVALLAAVALAMARLSGSDIGYAPWSSGTHSDRSQWADPGSWSTDAFAAAVRLPEEQADLQTACRLVAARVAALVGVTLPDDPVASRA